MMQSTPLRMFFYIFACLLLSAASLFAATDPITNPASPVRGLRTTNAIDTVNASEENTVDTGKASAFIGSTRNGGEDGGKNNAVQTQPFDSQKNTAAPSLPMLPQTFHYDAFLHERDSVQGELFRGLGTYHRLMGIYGVIGGALTILAGAILLDRENSEPFAMAFMVVGGISVGLGLWEIKVGAALSGYKSCSK